MSHILQNLADNEGAKKRRMRVGRGIGSGKGKTCGRGGKGQTARSGVAINGFEGGQMPIYRRLPKRGFNNFSRRNWAWINLSILQRFVESGVINEKTPVTVDFLYENKILKGRKEAVKLLAKGTLKAKLNIEIDAASEAAIKAVEKAGGKVTITAKPEKAPEEKKTKKTTGAKK
jgi:large subunit ribosomal protein L15